MLAGSVGASSDRGASTMLRKDRWVSAKLQEEPPSLSHGARERSEVPLAFGSPLTREGLSAEPPSGASLGRGVSAPLQKELPSLCTEQEGRQEVFWLFERPSRFLFARKEGLFCRAPSCASLSRWASVMFCRKSPLASA